MTSMERIYELHDPTSKYYCEVLDYPVISQNPEKNDIFGKLVEEDYIVPNVVRNLKVIKEMNIRKNDTLIIGFPKSGKFSFKYI
jgi:disulfide oxidoreductase YuzD